MMEQSDKLDLSHWTLREWTILARGVYLVLMFPQAGQSIAEYVAAQLRIVWLEQSSYYGA